MEVSIVSHEFVMPSCGTPQHPKTHLLSFIDQFVLSNHIPVLLFYSSGVDAATPHQILVDDLIKKRMESLKQSLSKTLASFYPLAGRLSEDKNSIICSDEGVYFVEASVKANLSNFLQKPDLFHKLVPAAAADNLVALVQVSRFTCGGLAICASISHKIADASSISFFLRSWAATANDNRESYQISAPNFDGSTLFPPTDICTNFAALMTPFWKRGRSVTKRFVFDAEAIVALKAKASSSSCKRRSPSRVEAVSALICKSFAAAMKARPGKPKPVYATHVVNIRGKAIPSLPESCVGNYLGLAPAALGMIDQDIELPDLVTKMREEIKTVSDYVKSLQSEPEKLREEIKTVSKSNTCIKVTSTPERV